MDKSIYVLIDEAIKLELNMSKLYGLFREFNDKDHSFWYKLEVEEKNHAALLKTARDFVSFNRFPEKIIPEDISVLEESNRKVSEAIDTFILAPEREKAFSIAIELEKSAGEIHYQYFMEQEDNDRISEIFRQLNREDKHHAQRIKSYWQHANV
jgi:hypothetical protein